MNAWTRFEHRLGLWRSVLLYHGIPFRRRQLTRFYARFIQPGDLCFDIGAHVGSRLRAWLPLGARIVSRVRTGVAELFVSPRTPTVTSLSPAWIAVVRRDPSFERVRWDHTVAVPVTTLDRLIAAHGLPAFCKIDVEGYELEVLKGLSQPIRALSFEYLRADLDAARACVVHLAALGPYEFNGSAGEAQRLRSPVWLDADDCLTWLDTLARASGSGDLYARLREP